MAAHSSPLNPKKHPLYLYTYPSNSSLNSTLPRGGGGGGGGGVGMTGSTITGNDNHRQESSHQMQTETFAKMKPLKIISHKLSSFSDQPLLPTQHPHQTPHQQQQHHKQNSRRHASSALTKKKQEYQFHETASKISLHNSHVLEGLTHHPQLQRQQRFKPSTQKAHPQPQHLR